MERPPCVQLRSGTAVRGWGFNRVTSLLLRLCFLCSGRYSAADMDPENKLTFCLGLKNEEMTMSFQGLYRTEAATVAVSQKESNVHTVNKVVKPHRGSGSQPVVSPKYCPGANNSPGYLCETGHCCGETGCCTYYYELWWFWLLWTVLILFSCFCAYRHRRAKLRIQQQQRQREINLIAYNGACNYPSSTLDLSFLASFKLPSYEEVAAQPYTPPPPYSSVFLLQGGTSFPGPGSSFPHHHHHRNPCPPYRGPGPGTVLGPGPSAMTSSQSSDNYTSCSCESCSLTSPSSTSFSFQVTDETYDSSRLSTPSDAGSTVVPRAGAALPAAPSPPLPQPPPDVVPTAAPDVVPLQRHSPSNGSGGGGFSPLAPSLSLPLHSYASQSFRLPLSPLILLSSLSPGQIHPLAFSEPSPPRGPTPRPTPSPPKQAPPPFPVAAAFTRSSSKEEEDDDDDDDEEDHFRHRRLTGDSGIEVCRCHVKRAQQEEEELKRGRGGKEAVKGEDGPHDSVDCSLQAGPPPPSSSRGVQKTAEAS